MTYKTPRPPLSVHKYFSPIGRAVSPALGIIYMYTNILFYYIDRRQIIKTIIMIQDMYMDIRIPIPVNVNPGMVFPRLDFR